jgi:hypothetical protein
LSDQITFPVFFIYFFNLHSGGWNQGSSLREHCVKTYIF